LRAAGGPDGGASRVAEAEEAQAVQAEPSKLPLHFAAGDGLAAARRMAETRVHAVAPWGKDVDPKPIFAVSDGSGNVARRLVKAAFAQFGNRQKSRVSVWSRTRKESQIKELVDKAASRKGVFIAYTFASPDLSAFIASQCAAQGVPCLNVLETTLATMEKHFDMRRSLQLLEDTEKAPRQQEAVRGTTVFAASDSSGSAVEAVVRAALRQLPGCGVETVTLCPRVHSLEEVDHIAQEAFASDSLVVFSFASPGMSRFMRQQCERVKVPYTDVYQPVVIALEMYLNYPPVGVPGGLDLGELDPKALQWEVQPL